MALQTDSEHDRIRYEGAWVCRNGGCNYRELLGDSTGTETREMETPRRRRKDREPVRHVGDSPVATPVAEDISVPFRTSAHEPSHDDIARRAYELYEQRGGEHGHDWEDWFQAECELRQPAAHQGIDTIVATTSTYAAV